MSAFDPKRTCLLRAITMDDHRASMVIFFAVAATFVFFLPVVDNFVDLLALLACCTYLRRRFDLACHEAVNTLGP